MHTIRPVYLLLLVVGAQGQVTLTVSPNPAMLGQSVRLTATVTSDAGGKITFYDGVNVLGVRAVAARQASLSTSLLAAGSHQLRALRIGALGSRFPHRLCPSFLRSHNFRYPTYRR